MIALAPTQSRGVFRALMLVLFSLCFAIPNSALRAQGSSVRVETFSLKPDGEVVVENTRGATRVESWGSNTVRVVAEKKAPIGASIEPGELVLMGAQNSLLVQARPGPGRVDLTLYIPHGAQLQVVGGAWAVDVSGVLAGASIDTTSGNIAYRLAANDDARITMRSAGGIVRSAVQLSELDRDGTRGLQGQIGTGASQVILTSQSGNVTLSPGPNIPASTKTALAHREVQNTQQSGSDQSAAGNSRANPNETQDVRNPASGTSAGNSGRPASSSGSVSFAGSDRGVDSNSTTTAGPFVRPREQRTTSGGDSGLKVRIIPSSSTLNRPVYGTNPSPDNSSQQDQQSNAPSSRGSNAAPSSTNSGGDVVDFAGSDRSSDGGNQSRVGPLERERQARNMSGGNSGLKVRIIPAPNTNSAVRSSGSVFDNRDEPTTGAQTQSGYPSDSRQTVEQSSSGRAPDFNRPRKALPVEDSQIDDRSSTGTDSRASIPELKRNNAADPTSGASNETDSVARSHDEDTIVLKAALVNLNVSVTNRSGIALAGLKKEDFEVAENGEPQKVEFFQTSASPFNLVLALDLSGSIKEKLDVVKSAALKFLEVVGPQDRVAVVSFTDEIRVVSQLTSDREELRRRIKAIDRSQGGTAFYEAMWFSLIDTLRGTRGQRNAIVVMTDGVDSSLDRFNPMQTRVSFNQLARRLEESDVLMFPIYLDTEYEEVFERGNSTSEAYAIARDQLDRLAELSGGKTFKAEKVGDLSGVYKQVAAALRTVYSVGYYPTNAEKDGTYRRVRVSVNRSDAAVRTRKGYYAR